MFNLLKRYLSFSYFSKWQIVLLMGVNFCLVSPDFADGQTWKVDISLPGAYPLSDDFLQQNPNIKFDSQIEKNIPIFQYQGKSYLLSLSDRSIDPEYPTEVFNHFSFQKKYRVQSINQPTALFNMIQTNGNGQNFSKDSIEISYHLEKDLDYYQGDPTFVNQTEYSAGKGWIWNYFNKGSAIVYRPSAWLMRGMKQYTAQLKVKGVSRDISLAVDHQVDVQYQSVVQSISFTGYSVITPTFHHLNNTSASQGYRVTNVGKTGTSVDRIYLDWIKYSGKFGGVLDTTVFEIKKQVGKEYFSIESKKTRFYVLVDSSTSTVILPEVKSLNSTNQLLTFSQSGLSNHSLFLIDLNAYSTSTILPDPIQVTDQIVQNNNTHLLVIYHQDYFPFVQEYKSHRNFTHPEKNIDAVSFQDISWHFGHLNPTPHSLKNFIRQYYIQNPNLKHVLLVGNSSWDVRGITKRYENKNHIPSYGNPASDQWLVSFHATNQILNPIAVARLPLNSNQDGFNYLEKLKTYESRKGRHPEVKNFTFINGGFDLTEQKIFFSQTSKLINEFINAPLIKGEVDTIIRRVFGLEEAKKEAPKIINAFKKGTTWVNFIGHAGSRTWDLMLNDVNELQDTDGLFPFVTSLTCFTGDYANPNQESFSEEFVLHPKKGAIAFMGTSGLGYVDLDEILVREIYRSLLATGNRNLLDGIHYAQKYLAGRYPTNSRVRSIVRQYVFIGDPLLELPISNSPDLALSEKTNVKKISDSDFVLNLAVKQVGLVQIDTLIIQAKVIKDFSEIFTVTKKVFINQMKSTIEVPISLLEPGRYQIITDIQYKMVNDLHPDNNSWTFDLLVSKKELSLFNFSDNQIIPGTSTFDIRYYLPIPQLIAWNVKNNSGQILKSGSFQAEKNGIFELSTIGLTHNQTYLLVLQPTNDTVSTRLNFTVTQQAIPTNQVLFSAPLNSTISEGLHIVNQSGTFNIKEGIISAGSAGFLSTNFGYITINDTSVFADFRGIFGVVLDSVNLKIVDSHEADLWGSDAAADELSSWIQQHAASNNFMAFVVKDDGTRKINNNLKDTFRSIGSVLIDSIGYRHGWTFATKLGQTPKKLFEGWSRDQLTKVYSEATVLYSEKKGSIEFSSQPSYKLAELKGINLSADSVWIQFDQQTKQLLPFNQPTAFNLLNTNAITLYFSNSLVSNEPKLKFETVTYLAKPQVGINKLRLSKDSLMVGEPFTAQSDLFVIYPNNADSVKVNYGLFFENQYRLTHSHFIKVNSDLINTTWDIEQEGTKVPGDYEVHVDLEGELIIPSFSKAEIPFTVASSPFDPEIIVKVNGKTALPNSKELTTKDSQLLVSFMYPDFLLVSDTNSVKLTINNMNIPIGKFVQVKTENGINETSIELPFTFQNGTNILSAEIKMPLGPFSQTPKKSIYSITVNDKNGLLQVLNFPNPFQINTNFSMLVTGASHPEKGKIDIFTVNGRKIHSLEFLPTIGWNSVSWDGRDKDGDHIANGVYFYKVYIDFSSETMQQTNKLYKYE